MYLGTSGRKGATTTAALEDDKTIADGELAGPKVRCIYKLFTGRTILALLLPHLDALHHQGMQTITAIMVVANGVRNVTIPTARSWLATVVLQHLIRVYELDLPLLSRLASTSTCGLGLIHQRLKNDIMETIGAGTTIDAGPPPALLGKRSRCSSCGWATTVASFDIIAESLLQRSIALLTMMALIRTVAIIVGKCHHLEILRINTVNTLLRRGWTYITRQVRGGGGRRRR